MNKNNSRGLKDWVIFIKIIESGSLSRAALGLDISVAAVSKSLARLESYVNANLIRRDSHTFEPTEAGRTAYIRAKEITGAFQSLLDELRNPEHTIKGSIRLSAPAIICDFLANQWAFEFTEQYPASKIFLDSRERGDFSRESPEFDDIVLKRGHIESEELIHRKLSPLKLVICATQTYLNQHEEINHPRDLEKHRLLGLHYHHEQTEPLTLYKQNESYTIDNYSETRLSSNNILSTLNLALQHKGINLITPDWLTKSYIKNNELKIILPEWSQAELPIYLVWRHRQYYSPLFRAFAQFITDKWNNRF